MKSTWSDHSYDYGNPNTGSGYGYAYNKAQKTDPKTGGARDDSDDEDARHYGSKVVSGDIIEMHCDMNKLELSFSVNGIDQGVAFREIEKTKYKVAVNLYVQDDMVTLLD